MRCKICNIKFKAIFFKQQSCLNAECVLRHSKEVKLSKWEDSAKKNKTTPAPKKKTTKALLQDEINKLARQIDKHFGYECIDCDRLLEYNKPNAVHGAHRFNVGGHENIRFNLHNIHSSTLFCNKYNTEHKTGYDIKLVKRYDQDYYDQIHQIDLQYPVLKLNELELKQALKIVRKLNREFTTHLTGHLDGAMLRAYFNNLIDIYK